MNGMTVAITGGGSGIGAAVAQRCAAQGARVGIIDVDGTTAARTAREAIAAGAGAAAGYTADVSDEHSIARALHHIADDIGCPTAVFANAGIERNGPAHRLQLADWEKTLRVNLTGVFLTCKHAIAQMLDAELPGSVVATSSPSALVGFAGGGNAAYGASKGGISALVRSLALDYAPHGIRVNAVVPGATDTPLLLADVPSAARAAARSGLDDRAREQIPLGRLGTADEIAGAVVWLLSDEASYVTGSHLVCDGGLLARSANDF